MNSAPEGEKKLIRVIAPAGPLDRALADRAIAFAAAAAPDLVLDFHPQCFQRAGHFAGTDAVRRAAFVEAANDEKAAAVWFAKGGYGSMRLGADVFAGLGPAARRKTYLGYSDTGALLAGLYREGVGRPVHGPMPVDIAREGGEAAIARALRFLAGRAGAEDIDPAAGREKTVAFNITVLSHLCGTGFMPDLSGHVLMLEDVSEYLYSLDRSFRTIAGQDWFPALAGLRLGRVSDIKPNIVAGTEIAFGETPEEIARRICASAGVAFSGGAAIGHDADNRIVPFGGTATA